MKKNKKEVAGTFLDIFFATATMMITTAILNGDLLKTGKKIKAMVVRESLFNKMKKDKKRERLLKLKRAKL